MQIQKAKLAYWKVILLLFVAAGMIGYMIWQLPLLKADAFSWLSDEAVAVEDVSADYAFDCARQSITTIERDPTTETRVRQYQACVTVGKNISLAQYTAYGLPRWAVKIGGDSYYRAIRFANFDINFKLVRDTNMFVFRTWEDTNYRGLSSIGNIVEALYPSDQTLDGRVITYDVDLSSAKHWFRYESDGSVRYYSPTTYVLSPNGKYMLAWLNYRLMVKVDMQTGDSTGVGYFQGSSTNSLNNPYGAGISNDGRYAFVAGGPTVIDTQGCGFELTEENLTNGSAFATTQPQCPHYSYATTVVDKAGYNGRGQMYSWNSTEEMFQVKYQPSNGDPENNKLITIGDPQSQVSKLDYLALGDSYSSGEGDTEKDTNGYKHYRAFTDVELNLEMNQPREKCHISTRSYPYRLAASMNLTISGPKMWDTVACAGAQIKDVIASGEYQGQGEILKDFDVQALQAQALNEFIPGRVQQIEFVKKYKPKAITLTMGGNDVGFGPKIRGCALTDTSILDSTCSIAKYDKRTNLKNTLSDQFKILAGLYADLHTASPKSKIYVIGYPRFINAGLLSVCAPNVLSLNKTEREMIDESVKYFNNIIESASRNSGVKYVDVEDSLLDHMLCDTFSEKYVTGVAAVGDSELQESFHPNAKGHAAMAQTIQTALGSENLLTYDTCPQTPEQDIVCPDSSITEASIEAPEYFETEPEAAQETEYTQVTLSEVAKNSNMPIETDSYAFAPASTVTLAMYSERTELGTRQASEQGEILADMSLPDSISVGYHTLVLEGKTYSGESVTYEQIILVKGSDPNDIDDDGITDDIDKCLFVEPANIDEDQDNIDDACDPDIALPPQPTEPYRVRMGNPLRTYMNEPENERYMYVERNVHATALTGVTGDADPDGDGWAIVAASQGSLPKPADPSVLVPDIGPAAHFVLKGTTVKKPFVYVRTPNNGCVGLTPASLAQVAPDEPRPLKIMGLNNAKCRIATPSEDIDENGEPDGTQPLYMARNGISSVNEDPAKLYLFRSHAAAEAQLGVSDYSPTGTAAALTLELANQPIQPWNLLAYMQTRTGFTYNKLVILTTSEGEPTPTILATKSGKCHAFQPQNVNVIRKNTQNLRGFEKLTALPEGADCE